MSREQDIQELEKLVGQSLLPCKEINEGTERYVKKYGDDKELERVAGIYYERLTGVKC